MNITSFSADTTLKFTLSKPQLEKARERIENYLQEGPTQPYHGNRSVSFAQEGLVGYGDRLGGGKAKNYRVTVSYDPSAEFSYWLFDKELFSIQNATDLDFHRSGQIRIADLEQLTGEWSVSEGRKITRQMPEKSYSVGIDIMGTTEDTKALEQLREMSDHLYLPVRQGSSWHTQAGGIGKGGSHPTIMLRKDFVGDITPHAEARIEAFYQQVKNWSRQHGITTDFKRDGKTWTQYEREKSNYDLAEHIAASTAAKNGFFAPSLRIDAVQPICEPRPKAAYKDGNWILQDEAPVLLLTMLAETIFPPPATKSFVRKWNRARRRSRAA